MKIAYLSGSYLPSRQANSVHVMRMTSAIADLGHEVTLYAYSGNEPATTDQLRTLYRGSAHVAIERMTPRRSPVGRELKYALQLRSKVGSLKPDLIYGRHLLGLLSCINIAPSIYETHALRSGVDALIEKWLLRQKNLRSVVLITHGLADDFRTARQVDVPVVVEPDAVEPVDYSGITAAEIGGAGRLKVGYCGHLYPGRGAELLLKVAEKRPDYEFHLVGGEPNDFTRLSHLAKHLSNVRFHGFVPPRETPRYLAAFDILVAPYQRHVSVFGGGDTARWMSPMKLFEYMDAGKPIVISDLPVISEVVTNREHALLVDPEDTQRWCKVLDSLIDDRLRKQLGTNAQNLVRQKYTWRQRAQRILSPYAVENGGLQ